MAAPDSSAQPGLRRLLDALPDPLLLLDDGGRILQVNRALVNRLGRPAEQLVGQPAHEVIEQARNDDLRRAFRRVLRTHQPEQLELELPGDGRWLDVRLFRLEEGVGVEYREITDHKREQVRNLELADRHATVETQAQALHAFAHFTETASHTSDLDLLARHAVQVLHRTLDSGDVAYLTLAGGLWTAQVWAGELSDTMLQSLTRGLPADAPIAVQAAQLNAPMYAEHWREQDDPVARLTHEYASVAITPVHVNDELLGLLVAGQLHDAEWGERERATIQAVWRSMNLATERALVTRRLERKRERLEAANTELDAFAHAVAHDLRAPVRHVTSFMSLLRRALDEGDSMKALRFAGSVERAADRMDTLIASLLEFSRYSEQLLHPQHVDLNALVEDVRTELLVDAPDRVVRWRVADLPTVHGDPQLLRMVLLNLLGNALKYTAKREAALIEVWAVEDPLEYTVHVQDNGAGFDQRYADRLFTLFQRLHREQEFAGTGVGLATVQRIIHRHGGRVWARGTPGAGAVFSFTLPK